MHSSNSELPLTQEKREWVDDGFIRISKALGHSRMIETPVILPTPEFFPDPYDESPVAAEKLFTRVCQYMGVDRRYVDLEIFGRDFEKDQTDSSDAPSAEYPDLSFVRTGKIVETENFCILNPEPMSAFGQNSDCITVIDGSRKVVRLWKDASTRCVVEAWEDEPSRIVVPFYDGWLPDTLTLTAHFAHQLGHVILIGRNLVDRAIVDMDPLTDLLTVFLGLGIFTANAAFQIAPHRRGYPDNFRTQGSLAESTYGYALAKFAAERGEIESEWAKYLTTNVRAYYERSRRWLMYASEDAAAAGLG